MTGNVLRGAFEPSLSSHRSAVDATHNLSLG
jgi:hypothetical protein